MENGCCKERYVEDVEDATKSLYLRFIDVPFFVFFWGGVVSSSYSVPSGAAAAILGDSTLCTTEPIAIKVNMWN